jgi:hypothetical protein
MNRDGSWHKLRSSKVLLGVWLDNLVTIAEPVGYRLEAELDCDITQPARLGGKHSYSLDFMRIQRPDASVIRLTSLDVVYANPALEHHTVQIR